MVIYWHAWISVVIAAVSTFLAIRYRRDLRAERRRSERPRLRITEELIPPSMMKGFFRRSGIRIHLVNEGTGHVTI